MSGFWLKLIAVVTMLVDHVGAVFFEQHQWMRLIGRLSFPLFCFAMAEGMCHTRDRVKYLRRLTVFALLSELPFDLAFSGAWWDVGHQNVLFTFAAAVAGILLYEQPQLVSCWAKKLEKSSETHAYRCADEVVRMFAPVMAVGVAYGLRTDYDAFGVLLVYLFYFTRRLKTWQRAAAGAAAMLIYGGICALNEPQHLAFYLQTWGCAALAALPMLLYNGRRGPRAKWMFYAFYPMHLLIIGAIAVYLV